MTQVVHMAEGGGDSLPDWCIGLLADVGIVVGADGRVLEHDISPRILKVNERYYLASRAGLPGLTRCLSYPQFGRL